MKLRKTANVALTLWMLAALGGWRGAAAGETANLDVLTAAPVWLEAGAALPMTPLTPPPASGEPSRVEASCHTEDCGNTGTLYGYGANCTTAKADLDSEISAASYEICPDIVTGVDRHYVECIEFGGQCRYEGNADIECKICPGMFCW